MKNHDRLHAFIVRHTPHCPRSSRRTHRISIHKNWLRLSALVTAGVCLVALYGLFSLVYQPFVAAKLADENERLRHENEFHRQQLGSLVERIEAVEDASHRIARASGVAETPATNNATTTRPAGGPALPTDGANPDEAIDFVADRTADLEQKILSFAHVLRERSRTPSVAPVAGTVTDGYGVRSNPFGGEEPEFHGGLDIAAPTGTPVVAAGTGTITFAGWHNGYGQLVVIDHGNGYQTRYGHLSAIDAGLGANVTRGELVGRVGSTGRSTGAHLHYEVRVGDRHTNPRRYLPAVR